MVEEEFLPLAHIAQEVIVKQVMEMDGGDGCTIVPMYLIPLNCTFENG